MNNPYIVLVKKGHLVKKIACILVCCTGILGLIPFVEAAETLEKMPVERLDLQANLLRAVLKFSSRKLDHITVGIIYTQEAEKIAHNFATEIKKLTYNDQPIQIVFIAADTLDGFEESVNVVYVTPGNGALLDMIAAFTADKNIFSCTGIPEYVREQKIALGFEKYQGKPQLILNLSVARSAEHEFKNPKFLNLQTTRKLILIK